MKNFAAILVLAIASIAQAAPVIQPRPDHAHKDGVCFPKNNLHLQDRVFNTSNITQEQFNQIIDEAAAIYGPIVEAHGGKLEIQKLWTNSTVNAEARQTGNRWQVLMYGGLARRPEVTPDGFALVVCHELGHHLAGFAFKSSIWASSEGQSDYFATHACAKALWNKDPQNRQFRTTVDPIAKEKCDQVWAATTDRELCYRTSEAGLSLATLLGTLGGTGVPKFSTPDTTVVRSTNTSHPAAQCRLDTYMNGALCKKAWDEKKIPGRNHPSGQTSTQAEQEAYLYTCSTARPEEAPGARPACWFKPKVTSAFRR